MHPYPNPEKPTKGYENLMLRRAMVSELDLEDILIELNSRLRVVRRYYNAYKTKRSSSLYAQIILNKKILTLREKLRALELRDKAFRRCLFAILREENFYLDAGTNLKQKFRRSSLLPYMKYNLLALSLHKQLAFPRARGLMVNRAYFFKFEVDKSLINI